MSDKQSLKELIEKKEGILIPAIQRDYVQGNKKEIREGFSESLVKSLKENKNLHLDFIYGYHKEDKKVLVPLDGQQRLTTVFLLYFSLALKENRISDFQSTFYKGGKEGFIYEFRPSSRDFCRKLLGGVNEMSWPKEGALSSYINNLSWFKNSWKKDPSVQSMLKMLDTFYSKLNKLDANQAYYDRLENIQFDLLDTEAKLLDVEDKSSGTEDKEIKGLDDRLYIKMNARGKQLSNFENFKASFEGHYTKLKDDSGQEKTEIEGYLEIFKKEIDRSWSDFFWKTAKNEYDQAFMRFFDYCIINHLAQKENVWQKKAARAATITKFKDEVGKRFYQYNNIETDVKGKLYSPFNSHHFLVNVVKLFQLITNTEKFEALGEKGAYYFPFGKDGRLAELWTSNKLELNVRVPMFAYEQFLLNSGILGANFTAENQALLEDHMRIVYNLVENTTVHSDNFINMIPFFAKGNFSTSKTLLDYFQSSSLAELENKGFNTAQLKEEHIKAQLIAKNPAWKAAIIEAEQTAFFKGQIYFLLKFAGIYEAYEKDTTLACIQAEEDAYLQRFKQYFQKAKAVFSLTSTGQNVPSYGEHLFERTLLSVGDYLVPLSSARYSFLIGSGADKHPILWRDYLSDKEATASRLDILKKLFDDPDFDSDHLESSLRTILEKNKTELAAKELDSWMLYFINYPECFSRMKKRLIRWEYEGDFIRLLGSTQRNHYHSELRIYVLWLELLKTDVFKELKMPETKTDDSSYPLNLALGGISVYWDYKETKEYKIKIPNDQLTQLEKVLEGHSINENSAQENDSVKEVSIKNIEDVITFLTNIAAALK